MLDIAEDAFGAALNDLAKTVAPFTSDGKAAVRMLAGIVSIAMEVGVFDPDDVDLYAAWATNTVGQLSAPVVVVPDDEDCHFPDEAGQFLAICEDAGLSIAEGLVALGRVVNTISSHI
jgi:phytoene/squalene synthetase